MKPQDYHKALDELERLQRENAELRKEVRKFVDIANQNATERNEAVSKLVAAEAARRDLDAELERHSTVRMNTRKALQFIGDVISVDHVLASQGRRDFYRFDISRSLLETWQRLERAAIDAAKTEVQA